MHSLPRHTFGKAERLKQRKLIGQVFAEGQTRASYPLRLLWLERPPSEAEAPPVQIAFTVPKRNFRKAWLRNRIKRRMREAYRLHKNRLYERLPEGKRLALVLIYTGREELPYQRVEKALRYLLRKTAF